MRQLSFCLQAKERQNEEQRQQEGHHEQAESTSTRRSNDRGADDAENTERDHEAASTVSVAHMDSGVFREVVI